MGTLFSGDNTWVMWAVVSGITALALLLENKTKLGAKIGAGTLCVLLPILFSTLHITPTSSPVYTTASTYLLPMCIPPLLFKCDVKRVIKESGKLFLIFHVACIGCIIATVLTGLAFKNQEGIGGIVAMMTGACTGGPVNLVAMAGLYNVDSSMVSACVVGVVIVIALLILGQTSLSKTAFIKKHFRTPYIDAFESEGGSHDSLSASAAHWAPKPISLFHLGMGVGITFIICAVANAISQWVLSFDPPMFIAQIFGSIFLVVPLLTIILVTLFPKFFGSLAGGEELGTLFICLYFVTVGLGSDLMKLFTVAPVILVMIVAILVCIYGILILCTRLFKWDWESICCAAQAAIGGQASACALSVAAGWKALIVPSILVGLWGYVIGNYLGIFAGNLFL